MFITLGNTESYWVVPAILNSFSSKGPKSLSQSLLPSLKMSPIHCETLIQIDGREGPGGGDRDAESAAVEKDGEVDTC